MTTLVFAPIATRILDQTMEWGGIASTLVTWVTPLVLIGLTISIIWQGFNIMRGSGGSMHLLDVFAKSLRAFLVVSLALGGAAYSTNVIGFFTELRTSLANLFSAAPPGASSYEVLDLAVEKAVVAMRSMMPWVSENTNLLDGNITGLVGLASMAFMVGCVVVYATISAVNLLLIDFSLAFVFAIGPLFVACLAFEATARFFDGWLSAALKYTFTGVVIAAVLAIGNGILTAYTKNIAESTETIDFISAGFSALGATGILVMLAFRVPEIAGNIVSGIGLSILGPSAGTTPLAAMNTAMKSGGRAATNAAAFGSGAGVAAAASTQAGQKVVELAQAAGNSTLGTRFLAANQAMSRFARATGNMESGSVQAAYNSGAGGGTGLITGTRPLSPPKTQ